MTKHNTISTLLKSARIEDKATGKFAEEIELRLSPDEVRRLQLPPSSVNDLKTLEDFLLDCGAILPEDPQEIRPARWRDQQRYHEHHWRQPLLRDQ
jgi:hypothetical protein